MKRDDLFDTRRRRVVQLMGAMPALWLLGCGGDDDGGEEAAEFRTLSSFYLEARDGTRLAADLWLPEAARTGQVGIVVELTRYVRSVGPASPQPEEDPNYGHARPFLEAGLAWMIVDARGTGASFGRRGGEQTPDEIEDFGDVFDWIAAQPWSNGRCGTHGVSYPGGNAEVAARLGHPHLKAVAPMFSFYDVYEHLSMPGGLYSRAFMDLWRDYVAALDRIDGAICQLGRVSGVDDCDAFAAGFPPVKPVDGADGAAWLAVAQREHQDNVSFPGTVDAQGLLFHDDTSGGVAWRHMSSGTYLQALRDSGVPYHVRASWLDGGSADGALARFLAQDNPQEVYIGATSHGGAYGSDPFGAADAPPDPSPAAQMAPLLAFFQRHLSTGAEPPARSKRLHYVTLGEGVWRTTDTWPPPGGRGTRLYLAGTGVLAGDPGAAADVEIRVDPRAGTGGTSRWDTVGNGARVRVDRAASAGLTRFVTAPLDADLRITGHANVQLELTAGRGDGAVFVYLEAIDPDGAITYVTEGELRLIHRRVAATPSPARPLRLPRSFARADALPTIPGARMTLQLDLMPTSVRLRAGHRLALCLTDRDVDHFDDYAGPDAPPLVLHTGAVSWIDFLAY
ncbi:MAG: CocE/NonD family hydrolase [Pigmentiphaga sp.]